MVAVEDELIQIQLLIQLAVPNIVLNLGIGRGIGVSVSGRIGDTSRESAVSAVNFLKSLEICRKLDCTLFFVSH